MKQLNYSRAISRVNRKVGDAASFFATLSAAVGCGVAAAFVILTSFITLLHGRVPLSPETDRPGHYSLASTGCQVLSTLPPAAGAWSEPDRLQAAALITFSFTELGGRPALPAGNTASLEDVHDKNRLVFLRAGGGDCHGAAAWAHSYGEQNA